MSENSKIKSIAFIIKRMNWFRHFGSLIDKGLQLGWHVECWFDVSAYRLIIPEDTFAIEKSPNFVFGVPHYRSYNGRTALREMIESGIVDYVVDVVPPDVRKGEGSYSSTRKTKYICYDAQFEWFYYPKCPESIYSVDFFALSTPHFFRHGLDIMHENNDIPYSNAIKDYIVNRSSFVGWAELDQSENFNVNIKETRNIFNIPEGKKILVYFNWVNIKNVNIDLALFSCMSNIDVLRSIILHKPNISLLFRRRPTLEMIVKSIRKFCDKNDMLFVVKARHRDKVSYIEKKYADCVVYDSSYYPHTIMLLMSIASLSVGYYSFAIRESVANKVPYIAIDVAGFSKITWYGEGRPSIYQRLSSKGEMFNTPGISTVFSDDFFINNFYKFKFDDYALKLKHYDDFFSKYIGVKSVSNASIFYKSVNDFFE